MNRNIFNVSQGLWKFIKREININHEDYIPKSIDLFDLADYNILRSMRHSNPQKSPY